MAEIGSAFLTIAPSAKGFGSKLSSETSGGIRSAGSSLGRSFGKLFVLGAGVIAAAGIGSFLKGSIAEGREAQQTGAQTAAVLKSTGQVANVSATQIGKLATSLSNKIGVDDEAIQAGENMLLTFTNVRNEVGKGNNIFAQATTTVQDMATAFGGDAVSNSKILGKALNDPVKGVSALTRVGVTFTDEQKKQIGVLVQHGNVLGAQKIILGELTKETKGSAEAQATAGQKASVAWSNVKEAIGTALIPILDKLENFLSKKIFPALIKTLSGSNALGRGVRAAGKLMGRAFAVAGAAVKQVWPIIEDGIKRIIPKIEDLAQVVGKDLKKSFDNLKPLIKPVLQAIQDFNFDQLKVVGGIIKGIGDALVSFTGLLGKHVTTVGAIVTAVVAMVAIYKVWILITKIAAAAQAILNAVLDANPIGLIVLALVGLVAGLIYAYKHSEKFRAVVDGAFGAIKKVISAVIGFVVPFIKNHWQLLLGIIGGPLGIIVGLVIKHFGTIKSIVSGAASFVVGQAKMFGKFASLVGQHVADVVAFFKALPGKIKGFLTALPGTLKSLGVAIVSGLAHGISAAAHWVYDAVKAIIDKIPKAIKKIMGIASPSKVTKALGEFISQGLADGIIAKGDKVTKAVAALTGSLKSKLKDLADSFKTLTDPITSNLTGDLFNFTTTSGFVGNLTKTKGTLAALSAAFTKLKGEGLSPGFLYQLFSNGGSGLILDLAAQDATTALSAASMFSDVNSLSDSLAGNVAGATQQGAQLLAEQKKTNSLLKAIDHNGKAFAHDVAAALSHSAGKAKQRSHQ